MAKALDLKSETPKPFRALVALGLLEMRGLKLMVERNRILTILLVLILFPPSFGYAEPRFDVSKKPVHSVTRYQADDGIISVTYLGVDQFGHKFLFDRDASKGSPLRLYSWSLRNGDTVRVDIDGAIITFEPHDCSLTLGKCTYVETHSQHGFRKMIWNAQIIDGIWHYTRHIGRVNSKSLMEKGVFTVEDSGYTINRDYQTHQDGILIREGWLRRIR